MNLSDFDFPFDPSLIADRPCEPRDRARMLVVSRQTKSYSHRQVRDLPTFLKEGDLLVVNDTKVMAVRLSGRKRQGGGRLDLVLIKDRGDSCWEALVKGRIQAGQTIEIGPDLAVTIIERTHARSIVSIESTLSMADLLAQYGQMPLPPYMKRKPGEADRHWYQTVFAREEGAIAAPTAGLHFTDDLLQTLEAGGVQVARITLHVGPATFIPVRVKNVEDHEMPSETFRVPEETCQAIEDVRARDGRLVAVGTTVARALEAASDASGIVRPQCAQTDLFILPGYGFRVVDGLMTNFHLPRTTLVMLVSAFLGRKDLLDVYREAIRERYRFYSYGDAMLVL